MPLSYYVTLLKRSEGTLAVLENKICYRDKRKK